MTRTALVLTATLAFTVTPGARAQATGQANVRDSVVQILVSHRLPNFDSDRRACPAAFAAS